MKNKLLLILFAGLFLISLTSASSDLIFKQGDNVNYTFVCLDTSNTYCNSGTTCQITINRPDGINLVNNASMPYSPTAFNYVLSTTYIGSYNWLIICQGSSNAKSEGTYQVTPSGFINNPAFYWIILLVSLGLIVLGLGMKDPYIVLFGTFGLYFISLYTLFYGFNGIKDSAYTWGLGLILFGVAAYISIKTLIELVGEK